jgi:hypothetical protein
MCATPGQGEDAAARVTSDDDASPVDKGLREDCRRHRVDVAQCAVGALSVERRDEVDVKV